MKATNSNEQVNGRVLAQFEETGLTKEGQEIVNVINDRVRLGYCTIEFLDEEEGFGVHFNLIACDNWGNEIFNERIAVRYEDNIDEVVEKLDNFTGAMYAIVDLFD